MSFAPPRPAPSSVLRVALDDFLAERRKTVPLPPGRLNLSLARTRRMSIDPLGMLLEGYREFGPVFALRLVHSPVVFMLGPEANHYITVSHAQNFRWREGSFRDLIPLLGDGMLTIDGDYHRRSRRVMLPVFHHDRVASATDTMLEEADRALSRWRVGQEIDAYHWTRALALRIAMRALFGLDPDRSTHGMDAAEEFERALSFYSHEYQFQLLRGPGTPFSRMQRARRELDRMLLAEIARRRASDERGDDILSLLIDAQDEDGNRLDDAHVRDQIMTLLFAGHDTTTSTVTFLLYELARHPAEVDRLVAEQDEVLGDHPPTAAQLASGLPRLEMTLDETLRLYPPAWIGPRRSVEPFEFAGRTVPGQTHVNYCSWASHRIPEVFPDPEAFVPERFAPEAKSALPKGAYVPFGGGSRTCIGMRFGQMEIKAITTLLLQRFRLELQPGYELDIRLAPTLSPRHGMPMVVRERAGS